MKKTCLLTLASLAAASLSGVAQAASDNPFAMTRLESGYQLAQADTKPMEGKCGADKKMTDKKKEGECGAAKDKKPMDKPADKKAEGKCGEAKCGAKK